jgi:hypothetical protein
VPGARRRTWDGFEGEVAAGAILANEELDKIRVHVCASRAGSEGEADEDEVLGGGDDAGLKGVVPSADLGAADARELHSPPGSSQTVAHTTTSIEILHIPPGLYLILCNPV